jgi:hypothetical protein
MSTKDISYNKTAQNNNVYYLSIRSGTHSPPPPYIVPGRKNVIQFKKREAD